jgi:hypothetical protein
VVTNTWPRMGQHLHHVGRIEHARAMNSSIAS